MAKRGGARPGAGRPHGSKTKATAEVKAAASDYAPAALKELARLATSAESEAARVAACKEILDRAYGKAPQTIEADVTNTNVGVPGSESMSVTAEWLKKLFAEPTAPPDPTNVVPLRPN